MRPHRERRPPAPFQLGGRQQGKSTGRAKPSAGDKGGSSPDGAPRKYKTSGASHMLCSPQQPAGQVLKPNNAPVTTECINRIEANAKLVGLARAIGIESISKSGYYKALRRIKRDGHATPPRPSVAPGRKRTYPLFSPEFASCRKYLEEDEPDLSYREAALNVVPPSSAANLCRTFGNGSADSNARSKKGLRSTQAGLKPLTSKKCQIVMSETNMPRILDMFLSWHNSVKELRTLRRSWTDESKIKYGHGQHGPKGRAPKGKHYVSEAPYRWQNATMFLAIAHRDPSNPLSGDIIKAHVQKKPMKGDDFANYVCKRTAKQGTTVLGGEPLTEMLQEIGVETLEYDMAGRAGRATDPSKGHFVKWLKPMLAQHEIKGLLMHPKAGMSDPIELVNYLVQCEVAKWRSGEKDSFDRHLSGPQVYEHIPRALAWAIPRLRRDGRLARVIKHAVEMRAGAKYGLSLFSGMSFYDDVIAKRATTPVGTPYTVSYKGVDVECKNLTFDPTAPITEEDKELGARCAWLPPLAPKDAASAAKSKAARRAIKGAAAAADWQPGNFEPTTLSTRDRLEIYVEVTEPGKGDYCVWMPASIEATRTVQKAKEFYLEYADTTKAWTRLAPRWFGKGRKDAPGWRLDPDFYDKADNGEITLKAPVAVPKPGAGAKNKEKKPEPRAKKTAKPKSKKRAKSSAPPPPPPPTKGSESDGNVYESDGLSADDSDSTSYDTGNPDIDKLSKRACDALRLDRNGDTDSDSDTNLVVLDMEDASEQGTQWGNAERILGIQSVCGTLASKCLLSGEGGAERREWLESVKGGANFVDFSSQTDEWMEVTEALESYESVCVIHVRGRSTKAQMQARVRSGSKRVRGGGIKNALLGKGDGELDPDPRKILTIIYNGRNHFCAVTSKGKLKPESEGSMGAGPNSNKSGMPNRLRAWLARHDCELWESTPNGYCGYESIAVSLLLLQEDK